MKNEPKATVFWIDEKGRFDVSQNNENGVYLVTYYDEVGLPEAASVCSTPAEYKANIAERLGE